MIWLALWVPQGTVAAEAPPGDYPWVTVITASLVAAVGFYSAYNARKKDAAQHQEASVAGEMSQFGVIGNLGRQIAEQILEQAAVVRTEEQHECNQRIESLQQQLDTKIVQLEDQIEECHTERKEFKNLLIARGLL